MPTQNLIPEITQLLLPLMQTPDERDLWLSQAFYFTEPRIYHQIDRTGAPLLFVTRCIKFLWDFSCFSDKTHPLSVLLTAAKMGCGADKQRQIEDWIPQLNGRCDGKTIAASIAPTPDQPIPAPSVPRQTIETPPSDRTPTVFVSYSRRDEDIAKRLIADLNAAGHACWFDQTSIKSDDTWAKAISAGINNSYAFVTLMSEAANASKWVMREYLAADEKPHLPVFVLQLEACDIPIQMKERQATRLYPTYEDGLHKLLASLPAPRIDQPDAVPGVESKRPVNQRQLELEYLSGLRLENWLKTIQSVEQYQTMAGTATTRDTSNLIATKYKHLAEMLGESTGETHHEPREYTDILEAIRDLKRAVLLGEPGAGKTTTLWRVAKDLFDTAIADPKAPIPILVRLGRWTDTDQSLRAFIEAELGELGGYLDKLIQEKRVVVLLDGLNEIPTAQRKHNKDAQVQAFIAEAQRANPDLIGVISCRERDYTQNLGFHTIAMMPLDPIRILSFVTRYLDPMKGTGTGEALFWQLAGDTARDYADDFKKEFASIYPDWDTLLWSADSLPDDMKWGEPWENRWYLWRRFRDKPSSLLLLAKNPYMLMIMTDIYRDTGILPDNRGELFAQFVDQLLEREYQTNEQMKVREADLPKALAKLAYTMQIYRGHEWDNFVDVESASTALRLSEVNPTILDDELLYLAGSASLLNVGSTVRFSHQLLQEYFVAAYMLLEIRAGRLNAVDLWKPENWWEPTGWEEATIFLVGMFPEHLDWVATANPELVAQCIRQSGANISQSLLKKFQALWIPRLTDLTSDPNPYSREAVGRAVGLVDLDNRPGVGLQVDRLPDIIWCDVLAGDFIFGNKSDNENPTRRLTLPAFKIAKYPITYKQYQAFIDAPDGYRDSQWWNGFHSDALVQQQTGPGDQVFKFWNHPRDQVSWYEAMAFCAWLSKKLGYEVRLPTEEEWDKAARGTDGQEYSFQNGLGTANDYDWEGVGRTLAVGLFPEEASPYGASDMNGNVFEWTLTEYKDDNLGDNLRVLRVGLWDVAQGGALATSRGDDDVRPHYDFFGFRILMPILNG